MPKRGGRYANKKKSGSKSVKSYDPANNKPSGGSGGPSVAGKYSPAGSDTPSAPKSNPGMKKFKNRGY